MAPAAAPPALPPLRQSAREIAAAMEARGAIQGGFWEHVELAGDRYVIDVDGVRYAIPDELLFQLWRDACVWSYTHNVINDALLAFGEDGLDSKLLPFAGGSGPPGPPLDDVSLGARALGRLASRRPA